MMKPGNPTVLIGSSCWSRIAGELERVQPCEGLVVPLVALERRRPHDNPCAMIELRQIRRLVIARAVLVPDSLQVNSWARVSVRPRTDGIVNQQVEALVRHHPALRACAYLHSHPFALGRTRPSRGISGDYEGHMLPLLDDNRQAGLNSSFSFIACRGRGGRGWRLHCFALGPRREIVDLGIARVVGDRCRPMRQALLPSLRLRSPYRYLLRHWRRQLRRQGLRPRTDDLFDGWIRTMIRVSDELELVILLPNAFPHEPAQHYLAHRPSGRSMRLTPPATRSLAWQDWTQILRQVEQHTEKHDDLGQKTALS
jgi:hypothetical protein